MPLAQAEGSARHPIRRFTCSFDHRQCAVLQKMATLKYCRAIPTPQYTGSTSLKIGTVNTIRRQPSPEAFTAPPLSRWCA